MASFYDLLLEALRRNPQLDMASDDPAQSAEPYPRTAAFDGPYAEVPQRPPVVASSLPRDPDFRQLVRVSNASSSSPDPALPGPTPPVSDADHAQQAREAAAARLARGVKSNAREGADLPPLDGTARGFVNGIPVVGPFNNKVEAALEATLAPVLNPMFKPEQRLDEPSWPERFARVRQIQDGIDARFAREYPRTAQVAEALGGMAGTALLGQTRLGAKMLGMTPGPLAERIAQALTGNTAIWGADAAARGNTDRSMWPLIFRGAKNAAPAAWDALSTTGKTLNPPLSRLP